MPDPAAYLIDGAPRVMGCLPPRGDFGGLPKFAAANGLIPRARWRDVDLFAGPVPVLDQGNHGSCVGHGSGTAFWIAYLIAGGTVPPGGFSPTSLYALINGGRDAGAIVSDSMDALMNRGLALMSDYPESVIYDRQLPAPTLAKVEAQRARFRVADAFHVGTYDEIGSALQLGFPVSFGLMLPGGFNNLDSEGVAGLGRGILGGHCMCAYGTARLGDGRWALRVRNSWGERWGRAGNCLMVEQHFGRGGVDAFAIRANVADPEDPNKPPVAP